MTENSLQGKICLVTGSTSGIGKVTVNYLAPFLLTELLLDTLKVSAPARIVNVSSAQHATVSIEFDNLQGEKKYANLRNYGQAKLALLFWTYELARRLEGTGVTVNALHPGVTASNFVDGMNGPAAWAMKLLKPFLLKCGLSRLVGGGTRLSRLDAAILRTRPG